MEDNFRNALIILSGIIIAAIFIHGLWTIRKQKNPYKLKTSNKKVNPITRDFDGSGFDQDGVGQAKVLKQSNEPKVNSEKDFEESISLEEIRHLENGQIDENYNELSSKEQIYDHEASSNVSKPLTKAKPEIKEEIILEQPMYQQPVTKAKPNAIKQRKSNTTKNPKKSPTQAEIKRNQMEINFGDGLSLDDEVTPNIDVENIDTRDETIQEKKLEPSEVQEQVIILSVVMPKNHQMSGAALLPSFLTLGLKYGEMNIFHRHQDNAGNGPVTFSVANMLNPGSFDLDAMETFATQGVSLFMTLPNQGDPFAAFQQMLLAAKQLASEFNAQILDDKRNVMTKQTEQHYESKIREFDRQHRLATA